jgi:hypothetical protein
VTHIWVRAVKLLATLARLGGRRSPYHSVVTLALIAALVVILPATTTTTTLAYGHDLAASLPGPEQSQPVKAAAPESENSASDHHDVRPGSVDHEHDQKSGVPGRSRPRISAHRAIGTVAWLSHSGRGPSHPYFHPYNQVTQAITRRTSRHQKRTSGHAAILGGRLGQTTQIYEGTNQIQRMVIARKTFGNVR